ncbi:MAG: ABC transporter ATP-binding protein [Bdellovibrionota bacterium]
MKSLLRLKPYVRPHIWLIALSGLLAIPLSAIRLAPAPLVQHISDDLLIRKDASKLAYFPLLFIALYVLNFFIRFAHYFSLRVVIARVNQKIKNELYEHLLGLSADYFTAQSTGTLISRTSDDPNLIVGGLATINVLIREPVTFIFLFGYAFSKHWKLTCVTLLIFPPLAWLFAATGKNLKRHIGRIAEEQARITSSLQESFTGIRVVKTFQLEKYLRKRFRERTESYTHHLLKTAVLEETSHPAVELLTAFIIASAVYFGGRLVLKGRMTAGELYGFFLAIGLMMNPIRALNDVNIKLNQASKACERIFEIFDWKPTLRETPNPKRLITLERDIALEDVSFAYPDAPHRPILKNVSFHIPHGQAVALVGASGAGKSSLVSLLPRIYDVTRGQITIDGQDIREYSLTDLRRLIAVVSQEVFLFNDTIEENIRCGRLGASREEIREAARRAHALEFIDAIPEGFQAMIGDRGQKLSGGQRQRLSIARAFLREAPILILDEATSSLDTASEKIVQQALDELMQGKTTLIIAHRLSTVQHADRIIVLKDGEIVETGNHAELLKRNGEYARFHELHT